MFLTPVNNSSWTSQFATTCGCHLPSTGHDCQVLTTPALVGFVCMVVPSCWAVTYIPLICQGVCVCVSVPSVGHVQVPWAHATFTTKERSRCVIVAAGRTSAAHDKRQQPAGAAAPTSGSSGSSGVFLGEPVAFYKLSSGKSGTHCLRCHHFIVSMGISSSQTLLLGGYSQPSC